MPPQHRHRRRGQQVSTARRGRAAGTALRAPCSAGPLLREPSPGRPGRPLVVAGGGSSGGRCPPRFLRPVAGGLRFCRPRRGKAAVSLHRGESKAAVSCAEVGSVCHAVIFELRVFFHPGRVTQVPGSSVCRSGCVLVALGSCGQFCGMQDVPALSGMELLYVSGGRLTSSLVPRVLSGMSWALLKLQPRVGLDTFPWTVGEDLVRSVLWFSARSPIYEPCFLVSYIIQRSDYFLVSCGGVGGSIFPLVGQLKQRKGDRFHSMCCTTQKV